MPAFLRTLVFTFLLTHIVILAEDLRLDVRLDGLTPIINSTRQENFSVKVEESSDLRSWQELGLFEHQPVLYRDQSEQIKPRFYRASAVAWDRAASDMRYINQVHATRNWLARRLVNYQPAYLKFVMNLAEPGKVYFHRDQLHYDFVTDQLPGFAGISAQEFERIALVRASQKLLLGTVFFPALTGPRTEVGIQFVGNEPYPGEFILTNIQPVKERIIGDTPLTFLYFPEYEQTQAAEESVAFLRTNGVETSSLARWTISDFTYSAGWATGKLKFFSAGEIQDAYRSSALTEADILITDFTPSEIPRVAGIITLNPSSPGSHVAILAQTERIPYVYLAGEELRRAAQALIGKEILFRAVDVNLYQRTYLGARESDFIKLLDISEQTPLIADALARAKPNLPLQYQRKEVSPRFSAKTEDITPTDFKYFGGKATHFGLLSRTISTNSPAAVGISFNLWDEFMQQPFGTNMTLRSAIDERLHRANQSASPAVLAEELDAVRAMIKNAVFTDAQKAEIISALQSFDSSRNIRFRSSSNVEDSATFIAAGLYDSYSGCLSDDLDGDDTGPSACDPTESEERGVFRAIKKVFASFYNDGAYFERRRRSVDEHEVGMALLVHHSFPDEIELANGVVLLTYQRNFPGVSSPVSSWVQTTQKGPVSVTNPEGKGVPEIRNGGGPSFNYFGSVQQWSSLVPFQQDVLHYSVNEQLGQLLVKTADAYAELLPEKETFVLDYEIKVDPIGLVIKQIREVPISTHSAEVPICFREDVQFRTAQSARSDFLSGPLGGPFSTHYIKSLWMVRVGPFEMTPEILAQPFYTNITARVHENGRIREFEGSLATLPGYKHSFSNETAVDEFSFEPGGPVYQLKTIVSLTNIIENLEVQTAKDWTLELKVTYAEPKPCIALLIDNYYLRETNIVYQTNVFAAVLEPSLTTNTTSLPVFRSWAQTNDWSIRADYFWVRMPETALGGAGFTSPLLAWEGTHLEGLTEQPISLHGFFSQTYGSKRKNLRESFVFDPWLEAGIPASILQELEFSNIRYIYCSDVLGFIGFDGQIRFHPAVRAGKPGFPNWWDR